MKNLKLEKIITYPSTLELVTSEEVIELGFDGTQGDLTREQWCEDEPLCNFDKEDQEKILNALENTTNGNFFAS